MKRLEFHIIDVFAERKYAGNQLATVFDAGTLDTGQMQLIARETNFAETSFVLANEERDGGFDVRIFTPRAEVPFAGHPTLGTAFLIRQQLLNEACKTVTLNLKVGRIRVRFEEGEDGSEVLWMHQSPPVFGEVVERETASAVLGLAPEAVDARFSAQVVSTGLPFLIVPLLNLPAVKRARLDRERYEALIENLEAKAVFCFSPEAYEPANQINARMFADYFGVPEDPATGSAAGCLAGYLVRHRYFGADVVEARVEQGYEIGRPSLLRLRAAAAGEAIEVHVGGKVIPTARGELL